MSDLAHRRLRAPTADGFALIDPPLDQIPGLVQHNRGEAGRQPCDLQGLSLDRLRILAREELRATRFTQDQRIVDFALSPAPGTPLILAGHQPELFHPGVWYKNFLLSSVAGQAGGIGVNLIVDTDLARNTAVRVPVKSGAQAGTESIAFDVSSKAIPYEERPILDSWLFESFGRRVANAYETCCVAGREPYRLLIEDVWKAAAPYARSAAGRGSLGLVLAEARHWVEWNLGLTTLELPLSNVAQSRAFRLFLVHILTELPQLWRVYNSALAEYRQINYIRSSVHPVPALQRDGDWLESPFFLWTTTDATRRHPFVRQLADSLIISDRQGLKISLDVTRDGIPDKAVDQLVAAEARGIKLRPRALITTMYARLVLSDLFIHGIGGAKYDEVTDLIIRRFFGIEPPAYITASATFRLPIERPQVTLEDVRNSARRIRETQFRPEAFVRDPLVTGEPAIAEKLAALAAEKREFLGRHDLRRCPPEVYQRLDTLNRAMHDLLAPIERELRAAHAELLVQFKNSQLLGSREFSFVLFPSEILPARLLDLCKVSP